MRSTIPNILLAFDEALWSITPQKFHAIREFLEARAEGRSVDGFKAAARPTPRIAGRIAVLPLDGCIAHHAGMEMEISGGTSTESFGKAFDEAVANRDIGAIVIDCNSPGGTVEGVPELAEKIFKARGAKPIYAVANANMNSAAYWICAAADQIFATPSANVGSIGVFTVHTDTSKMEDDLGVKRTVVSAGKYKAEAAGVGPLTDPAKAALEQRVDEVYASFTGFVAKARGTSLKAVTGGFGEGRSISAPQALAAGMIDKIATFDDVITDLASKSTNAGVSRFAAWIEPRTMFTANPGESFSAFSDRVLTLMAAGLRSVGTNVCPECGAPMVDGECTECDYVEPESPPSNDEGPEAAARRGTPAVVASTPVIQPAHQARSHSMSDLDTAQRAEMEAKVKLATEAAVARVNDITALCNDNGVAAEQRDKFIASSATVDAVARQILSAKRAERAADPTIVVGATRETGKPWETLGHFAAAVMEAATPGSTKPTDARLMAAAQGVNQAVPSEGGFLVPPQFSTTIWDGMANEADDLVGMTDQYPIDGESLTIPANGETSRATGSRFGGVKGYWINEADQVTKSKPKVRQMRLEPQELGVLIYATDKSLRNSPIALGSYLDRAAREEIVFMSGDALYRGSGAGQPLGLMNSGSVLTVNKETSQAAATIQQENISKMWARLHPRARAGAVWLMNVDCEPQLDFLNTVVKTVAGTENVGGYANKVYDAEKRTIKGRPIITVEYCETLGTKGDIALVNWGWYATGVRSNGVRADSSIHLRFDYNETAFRFMYELDGQPWLADPLTPYKGSNTLSWAILLQTR